MKDFPQTPEDARECVHGNMVWFGSECGECGDEIEWKVTTPVLVPVSYWSNGHGIVHQVRRLSYVHTPASAEPARGTRTLCGQQVSDLRPSHLGEGVPCKVCEAGGSNEVALIHSGLGTRWRLP